MFSYVLHVWLVIWRLARFIMKHTPCCPLPSPSLPRYYATLIRGEELKRSARVCSKGRPTDG